MVSDAQDTQLCICMMMMMMMMMMRGQRMKSAAEIDRKMMASICCSDQHCDERETVID